ncbi:hypothetical protein [Streptomyces sp. NPDC051132]|uniref:DUF7848 domain-containing protein n=1 Tax=unclassified Streptomyces TaxID=2593676 RepID=UPI00342AFFD0
MTPRSVLRYETLTLQPDREPDAEPVLYAMQCAMDRETNPAEITGKPDDGNEQPLCATPVR